MRSEKFCLKNSFIIRRVSKNSRLTPYISYTVINRAAGPRNPLPEGHNPQGCVEALSWVKDKTVGVRGNCDAAIDQMLLPFPMMADYLLLDLGEKMAFVTHGDQWGEDAPPAMAKGGVLITGHTHVAACTQHADFLYLNPGSPALPKDEGHRGYLLVDDAGASFCEMDGTVYREVKF